ncbi:MAG TPA: hypothetical protein VLY21_07790 [Nitrososphaerales archaeon]|nr:hypothetical protein [Nitrososphaerales archaeon]
MAAACLPFVDEASAQPAATCVKFPGNPVLSYGTGSDWDSGGVEYQSVLWNGSSFVMLYTGTQGSTASEIGFATSPDGVSWTKYPTPVLNVGPSGSWDASAVAFPSVIWNGSEYLMYYTGFSTTSPSSIGVAFSKDMVHWTEYSGNPILTPGPGIYDNVSLTARSVIYDPPLYKMWYSGRFFNDTHTINYATSSDGIHWTKYAGNPIMERSTNQDSYVLGPWGPSVVKLGSEYFAAYETDGLISSATSPDGIHWTASAQPLLLNSNSSSSFDFVIQNPWILLVNSTLYLWYSGFSGPASIGFAFCSLAPLVVTTTATMPTTTTQTVTQTTASTTTVTSQSTLIQTVVQTSTTTESAPSPSLVPYQAAVAVLAILLVAAAVTVFARRGRRPETA